MSNDHFNFYSVSKPEIVPSYADGASPKRITNLEG